MQATPMYTYLGTNGSLFTPIHLEGIYFVVSYKLVADNGKLLTKDNSSFVKGVILESLNDAEQWTEVIDIGQNDAK